MKNPVPASPEVPPAPRWRAGLVALAGQLALGAALLAMHLGVLALPMVQLAWIGVRSSMARRCPHLAARRRHAEREGRPPQPATGNCCELKGLHRQAMSLAAVRSRHVHRFARDGIEYLPDPTLVLDARARVLIANRAALKHWGAARLVGLDAHGLLGDLIARSDARPVVPADALRHSLAPRLGEATDRHGRVLLVRCVPFFDKRDTQAGWMVALVDITPMRQAQGQRDEALRFISHDIREPMATILTVLELARARPAQPTQPQMLERIRRHAQAGLELADGFVNVARAEGQALRPEPLDLVALLHQAVDDAWAPARVREVDVRVADSPQEAWVLGDRGLLVRALANVLSNALKYSPPRREVHCRVGQRPGAWTVSVRDEGPGIAAELQSQLFVPFRRLHQKAHPEVHGVGLGLLLVRTAVQRHGGSVEVDSAADAGCTVTLVLPRPDPAELEAMRSILE